MTDQKHHSIRFITSSYDELFRIPDGGIIDVRCPDRHFTAKCEHLDDYHTRINGRGFHICEFAELIERLGGTMRPIDAAEKEVVSVISQMQDLKLDLLSRSCVHEKEKHYDGKER